MKYKFDMDSWLFNVLCLFCFVLFCFVCLLCAVIVFGIGAVWT